MEDAVEACEVQLVRGEIEPADVEPARVLLLQRGVVVVRERVHPHDVVAGGLQRFREVRADEPRGAGHHVSHRGTIPYILA